jgi:hypothetical protein
MKIMVAVMLIALAPAIAFAQGAGRLRRGDPPPTGGSATLSITRLPGDMPRSLKELSDLSALIVEGVVRERLPSRETSPRALETDAIIAVNSTLKGPLQREVIISQRGGAKGDLVVTPVQYDLVQPGERYILFLKHDQRPSIPQVEGLPRYLVTGLWTGLFRFQEGRMQVSAGNVEPVLSKYEGLSVDQITSEIRSVLGR